MTSITLIFQHDLNPKSLSPFAGFLPTSEIVFGLQVIVLSILRSILISSSVSLSTSQTAIIISVVVMASSLFASFHTAYLAPFYKWWVVHVTTGLCGATFTVGLIGLIRAACNGDPVAFNPALFAAFGGFVAAALLSLVVNGVLTRNLKRLVVSIVNEKNEVPATDHADSLEEQVFGLRHLNLLMLHFFYDSVATLPKDESLDEASDRFGDAFLELIQRLPEALTSEIV